MKHVAKLSYTDIPETILPPGDNDVKKGHLYPGPIYLRRILFFKNFQKIKIDLETSLNPEFNKLKFLHSFLLKLMLN